MSEGALPLTPFIMSKTNNKVLTKLGSYIIQARRASDSIISYLFSIISVIYRSAINYCLYVVTFFVSNGALSPSRIFSL